MQPYRSIANTQELINLNSSGPHVVVPQLQSNSFYTQVEEEKPKIASTQLLTRAEIEASRAQAHEKPEVAPSSSDVAALKTPESELVWKSALKMIESLQKAGDFVDGKYVPEAHWGSSQPMYMLQDFLHQADVKAPQQPAADLPSDQARSITK